MIQEKGEYAMWIEVVRRHTFILLAGAILLLGIGLGIAETLSFLRYTNTYTEQVTWGYSTGADFLNSLDEPGVGYVIT